MNHFCIRPWLLAIARDANWLSVAAIFADWLEDAGDRRCHEVRNILAHSMPSPLPVEYILQLFAAEFPGLFQRERLDVTSFNLPFKQSITTLDRIAPWVWDPTKRNPPWFMLVVNGSRRSRKVVGDVTTGETPFVLQCEGVQGACDEILLDLDVGSAFRGVSYHVPKAVITGVMPDFTIAETVGLFTAVLP